MEAGALTRINNVHSQVYKERAWLQGENSETVLWDFCRQTPCHQGLRTQLYSKFKAQVSRLRIELDAWTSDLKVLDSFQTLVGELTADILGE